MNKTTLYIAAIAEPLSLLGANSADAAAGDCTEKNRSSIFTEERDKATLEDPGWFDIGAGIVVVKNAGVSQQNGVGNMVSLRAYPFGRWYAPSKTISAEKLVAASAQVNKAVALQKAADQAAGTKDAPEKQSDAAKAATDAANAMNAALSSSGGNFALCQDDKINHVIKRFSFFLGRSVGGFDSNAVAGDINAYGIAFDVAPQFALVWGRAYFNLPAQTGVTSNSKSGPVFGVQINLNAFKAMRAISGY